MKKILAGFFVLGLAMAAPFSVQDYKAGNANSLTVNISASAGSALVIHGILAQGDAAGTAINVQKADATGVTTNYTTVWKYTVGNASATVGFQGVPLYHGALNTGYRILLDSVTTGSILVTAAKGY